MIRVLKTERRKKLASFGIYDMLGKESEEVYIGKERETEWWIFKFHVE